MYFAIGLYVIGMIWTYFYTIKTIRNPNDEDRNYAEPPEWDFCHVGASLLFPIFWIGTFIELLGEAEDNFAKKVYDKNKRR